MNDLPTLLHERAERASLAPLDLEAITRAGDRRLGRRRLATYAGGLAVAGAVTATALLGGDGPGRAVDAAAPLAPAIPGPSWYLNGLLHHDGAVTDLGIDVATYVRTATGFVLVDTDDVVWSWTGGEPERVGVATPAGDQRLAGDVDGDLAAWVDTTGGAPQVRVLDQASGRVTGFFRVGVGAPAGTDAVPVVTAVDGDRVWWVEGARSLSAAVGADDRTRLPDGTRVLAAEDGRLVYEQEGRVLTTADGTPAAGDTVLDDSYRDVGALSPDGASWSADADSVGVVRTADAAPVPLEVGAPFSTGFAWLDDDSLVVLAGEGDLDDGGTMTARVLVCEVPAGDCTDVSGDLGTFDELEAGDFALPVGVEIG